MDIFNAPTVLWEHAAVVCTSRMVSPNSVHVTLTASGVVIEQKSFPTATAAADYAIEKMNAYNIGREDT
jgi:hypothetical protein